MLERYFRIGRRETPALNWAARRVPSGLDNLTSQSDDALRNAHARGVGEIRALMEEPHRDNAFLPAGDGPSVLDVKVEIARRMLRACFCCERRCAVDRTAGETGWCGVGAVSRYSSDFLHMGEEPELVPSHTIFFTGCTFECVYCQNWDIAMDARSGAPAEPAMLAGALREGLSQGSRNANFVGGNPDPHLYTILETVRMLEDDGRFLPMVWNSNMYTSREAMDLLDGVMDIYLGDFRYGNDECAEELSGVKGYFEVVSRNFAGAFKSSEVMVRHLVLPNHLECCTRPVMDWVGRNMPDVYFNLMFQYRPEYRAALYPVIDSRLSPDERKRAHAMAAEYGIDTGLPR